MKLIGFIVRCGLVPCVCQTLSCLPRRPYFLEHLLYLLVYNVARGSDKLPFLFRYLSCRKEWLEMKRMYQAMEKDHMRRLKQGEEGVAAGGEGEEGGRGQQTQRLRGFVANSLVQVKCRGDDVDLEKLKVPVYMMDGWWGTEVESVSTLHIEAKSAISTPPSSVYYFIVPPMSVCLCLNIHAACCKCVCIEL